MIVRTNVNLGNVLGEAGAKRFLVLLAAYCGVLVVLREMDMAVDVSIALAGSLGTALSILLGFRTNAAYNRWWEARKIWGGIVNDSRTFARKVLTLAGGADEALRAAQERLVLRQVAWCRALTRSLRKQDALQDLGDVLAADELEALRAHDNVPNALLQTQAEELDELVRAGHMDSLQRVYVDDSLTRLTDHMGKCERIKSTVFPYSYTYLVRLLLWLFAAVLPAAMIDDLGLLGGVLAFLILAVFDLIELSAWSLQDPFENRATDTPMSALSRTIEINLRQQLGQREVPEKLAPVDGVLM